MMDKYTNMNINSDGSEDEYKLDTGQRSEKATLDMLQGHKIIKLKTNFINLCAKLDFEQGLHQRQLPLTKDGPNAAEGGRRGVDFHDGWILRIQPGQDAP